MNRQHVSTFQRTQLKEYIWLLISPGSQNKPQLHWVFHDLGIFPASFHYVHFSDLWKDSPKSRRDLCIRKEKRSLLWLLNTGCAKTNHCLIPSVLWRNTKMPILEENRQGVLQGLMSLVLQVHSSLDWADKVDTVSRVLLLHLQLYY